MKIRMAALVALPMLFSSNAFALSGGLDYSLQASNESAAETKVSLIGLSTQPITENGGRLPMQTWTVPTNASGQGGFLDARLGRIEYTVGVSGVESYETSFVFHVTDNVVGDTDCIFVFQIKVADHPGGPEAVVAKAAIVGQGIQ